MDILRYYSCEDLIKFRQENDIDTDLHDVDGVYAGYLSLHSRLLDAIAGDGKTGGIYKLRGTVVWKLLIPLRGVVHHLRLDRQLYEAGGSHAVRKRYTDFFNPKNIKTKIHNKIINTSYMRKKKGSLFLSEVLPSEEEMKEQRATSFERAVKISVLVPLYNTPIKYLKDMIDSVQKQTYANWELCLADASDDAHTEVGKCVKEYSDADERIVYKKLTKNGGISDNTNECIAMSTGDYISLFDHDDILHPSALFETAKKINDENADFIYTDEATFEGDSLETLIAYHFKPDFSPDNLRGVNYICHLTTFSRALLDEVGGFRNEFDGSQDHDIILRLTSKAAVVSHVPKILYFWRSHAGSTSANISAKMYCIDSGLKAVKEAETSRGYEVDTYCTQICLTHYRTIYKLKERPLVSIVVFGGDSEEQAYTLGCIADRCDYKEYEVIVSGASAAKMNEAVSAANGDYVIFIGAGANPVNRDFVEELLMLAQRDDAGIVSGRVLDNRKKILHADKAFGSELGELFIETMPEGGVADTGFMGRMYYAHNVSASSVQFMMVRKDVFNLVGGFDAEFKTDGYDYDLAFRLREKGRLVIVNPYAMTQRRDNKKNELSSASVAKLKEKHKEEIKAGDPYYNRNLSFVKLWERKNAE